MKHVRIVIDEVTWYDGIPEELQVSQSDDTLMLKLGQKQRRGSSLGDLLGARREPPPPRRAPEEPPIIPTLPDQVPE